MTATAKAPKRAPLRIRDQPTDAELASAPDLTKLPDPLRYCSLDPACMKSDNHEGACDEPACGEYVGRQDAKAMMGTEGHAARPATCDHPVCAPADPASTFAPALLPPPGPVERPIDPLASSLAEALADGIWTADATAPRSLQVALGMSELGGDCDRRLMHHLRGTKPINHPDPLRAIVGTGVHLILADFFRRLDAGTGRYLVEQRLLWQNIPGTVDLYDRRRKVVIDWKTTTMAKIGHYRSQGPTKQQVVQIMGYGAALQAAGETVESVALAFVPTDGTLADIFVWRAPLDVTVAQRAVERLTNVVQQPFPATASPSAMCSWCPFYRPGSTDLTTSCPGKDPKQ